MLRFGSGYSQLGGSKGDPVCLQSSHSLSFNVNTITPFSSGQFFVPEIVNIFKLHFTADCYPTERFNPFCPYCLGLVDPQMRFRVCHQGVFLKAFLAHEECLRKQQGSCINTMVQQINQANLSFSTTFSIDDKKIVGGEKQWFVELQLSHCLTNKRYFALKKVVGAGDGELVWDFRDTDNGNAYFPNIIAFPYPDFDLSLSMTKLGQRGSRNKYSNFVDVQKLRSLQDRIVKISTDQYELYVELIISKQKRKVMIEQMNYKYRYFEEIQFPMIRLLWLKVKLQSEYSDEDMYICDDSNSNISNLLKQEDSLYSTFRSTDFNNCQDDRSSLRSQTRSQQSLDRIDFGYLIQSKELGHFVRHKLNSRKFQDYLSDARPEQLKIILDSLAAEFGELVVDEYGNYMMQKLFKICSKEQQYFILQKILPNLSEIAMNKQGTHTLQEFVSLLTLQKEFQTIIQRIMVNINELSFHSNSTHFVQKVIKHCPFQQLAPVFRKVASNFVEYAINKNALCVIKRLMNKVKDVEGNNIAVDEVLIKEVKKGFMTALFLNFNLLIQDAFGNYVVQFCYQTFGNRYCQGIANKIIEKFAHYSVQKYSSSVVYRCVTSYWNSKQTCSSLNSVLSSSEILSMYRNKDGNKILLALMQKYQGTLVHQKIYSQIVKAEPSKIAQDRWGMVLGCRSGTVGTYYNSFSQAVRPVAAKKKKKNNIIQ